MGNFWLSNHLEHCPKPKASGRPVNVKAEVEMTFSEKIQADINKMELFKANIYFPPVVIVNPKEEDKWLKLIQHPLEKIEESSKRACLRFLLNLCYCLNIDGSLEYFEETLRTNDSVVQFAEDALGLHATTCDELGDMIGAFL